MKILRIDLEHLRNDEHWRFMSDAAEVMSKEIRPAASTESDLPMALLFSSFLALVEKEGRAIDYLRKSSLTNPIADADVLRDKVFRGLSLYVQTYSLNLYAEKRKAAHRLQVLLDNYGDFRKRSYNEETAWIHNLLQDIEDNHTDSIAAIGAQEWVESLRNVNNEFMQLMEERYDEWGEQKQLNARKIRKQIDKVYKQLVTFIEIVNMVSNEAAYANLIDRLNERINYYKTTMAQRKGRAKAKDEDWSIPLLLMRTEDSAQKELE